MIAAYIMTGPDFFNLKKKSAQVKWLCPLTWTGVAVDIKGYVGYILN